MPTVEGKNVIVAIDDQPSKVGYVSMLDGSFQEFPTPRFDLLHMLQKEMQRAGEMIRDLRAEVDALKASK